MVNCIVHYCDEPIMGLQSVIIGYLANVAIVAFLDTEFSVQNG